MASIAQLAEHALRKRTVVGSIPTGGSFNPVRVSFLLLCRKKGQAPSRSPQKSDQLGLPSFMQQLGCLGRTEGLGC